LRFPRERDNLAISSGQGSFMLFIEVILPVFIIIFSGYLLEKVAKLDFRTMTCASLYLFSPALVFSALMKRDIPFELVGDLFLFMLLYTGAMLIISAAAGHLLKMGKETRGALHLTTVVMNVGNFGLPLAYFAFGDAGLEISVLTFVLFNIPLSTLAIVLAQGGGVRLGAAVVNMLKIPIVHGVLLAFVFKGLDLSLPDFVLRPIDLVGQAAIPLMLVMLGMQLARTSLESSFGFLTLSAVIRLAAAPLVALAIAALIGLHGMERNVVVLQTSTPSAVLPLLYALRFGTRPDLVAGAIFVSTLLSALSLTVLLYLLQG
jgi:malate permease and related proteins